MIDWASDHLEKGIYTCNSSATIVKNFLMTSAHDRKKPFSFALEP